MKRIMLTNLIFFYLGLFASSQVSVDATGGSVRTTKYSFSYSIGEIATATFSNSQHDIYATSGVIQPEITIGTKVRDLQFQKLIVFPNPVDDELSCYPKLDEYCSYTLFSVDGFYISSNNIWKNHISVGHLKAGVYLLKVKCNSEEEFITYFIKL